MLTKRANKIIQKSLRPVEIQSLEPRQLMAAGALDQFGSVNADAVAMEYDGGGRLHRVWRDTATGRLQYVNRSRQLAWSAVTTVDANRIGGELSIAFDNANNPAVSYEDGVSGDLMFARLIAGTWETSRVDSAGVVGEFSNLIYSNNKPYISYYDRTNGDLKLAWTNAKGTWLTQRLDTTGDVGSFSSLKIDSAGLMRIAYADNTNKLLKYSAQQANGTFINTNVDTTTTAGVRWISMGLDFSDNPQIAYYDVSKRDLKLAVNNGVSWNLSRVATTGTQGEFAHLSFIGRVVAVISYFNRSLGMVQQVYSIPTGVEGLRTLGFSTGQFDVTDNELYNQVASVQSPTTGKLVTSGNTATAPPANTPEGRIIQWMTIGGGSNNPAWRGVGQRLFERGWNDYVHFNLQPALNVGVKRVFLHNPFGVLPGQVMQFDQYIEAQEANLTTLTDGFAAAFKPVTSSGVEIIAYIGRLPTDPDFANLSFTAYMDRVQRSIQPLLDAGMSIGLDSILSIGAGSREFAVVQALRDSGVKVYAENRPAASASEWFDYPTVHVEPGFALGNPANNPDLWWAATNTQMRGEKIRFQGDAPPGTPWYETDWVFPRIDTVLRDGDSVGVNMISIAEHGVSMNDLYYRSAPRTLPAAGNSPTVDAPETVQSVFNAKKLIELMDLG